VRCCGGVRAVVRGEGRSKKQLYRALRPRVQKERENGRKTKTRKKKLWLSPRFLLLKFCNTPQASFDILRAVGKGEALAAAPSHQLLANMGVVMRTCAARSRLGGGGGPVAALLTVAVYALALALVAYVPAVVEAANASAQTQQCLDDASLCEDVEPAYPEGTHTLPPLVACFYTLLVRERACPHTNPSEPNKSHFYHFYRRKSYFFAFFLPNTSPSASPLSRAHVRCFHHPSHPLSLPFQSLPTPCKLQARTCPRARLARPLQTPSASLSRTKPRWGTN
jgi:hypothetical protein